MRKFSLWLFSFALLHGCLYALLTPPWQAPDEVAHFMYARLWWDLGRLPVDAAAPPELETQVVASLAQHRAWAYRLEPEPQPLPPQLDGTSYSYELILQRRSIGALPYTVVAALARRASVETQLYLMRSVSVLMGALVVWLTYAIAHLAKPETAAIAAASALFVLFLPQHTFISASVSDGNPAALAATLVIFLLARMLRRGVSWQLAAGLAVCIAYAILSKATTYFLIPLLVLVGPWLVWRQWPADRRRLGVAAAAALLLGLLALPTILAAPRLGYLRTMLGAGLDLWANLGSRWAELNADGQLIRVLGDTFRSFWAAFGWVVVWLPAGWYTLLFVLSGLAVAGLVVRAWVARRQRPDALQVYGLLALAPLFAIAVLVAWFLVSPDGLSYYQGRYLFSAIAPLAVLLVTGWAAWLPERARVLAPALVFIGMAALDVAALFGVAVPFFYAW